MNQIIPSFGVGLIAASVIALGAVGFSLQYGISRIFNISYGAMMTICAYIAYLVDVDLHTDLWLGLIVAGLAGAILALASERLLFSPFRRRRANIFAIVMLALALDIVAQNAVLALAGPGVYSYQTPAEHVYHVLGMNWTALQAIILAIGVVMMLAVHFVLRRTRLGKAMRATAADPDLAGSCGINVGATTSVAWALSGLLCGLGGVVLAVNTSAFNYGTGDGFEFVIFAAAVVGGIGQPYGAMLGALIIGIATSEAAIVIPTLQYVVAFVFLVVILLLRPAGLVQFGGRNRVDVRMA